MVTDTLAPDRGADEPIVIAVIEDDPYIREAMVRILEGAGYQCLSAEDGVTGLRLIRDDRPDLVFLDVQIPGIDGLTVLRHVRDGTHSPVVVITTAYGTENTAIEALRLRADDYLRKPMLSSDILRTVEKYRPVISAMRAPTMLPDFVVSRECDVEMASEIRRVPEVAAYLVQEAEMGRNYHKYHSCTLGLVELLNNAVEHGNLGISAAEKHRALEAGNDSLTKLYRDRLANPVIRRRRVRIHMTSTREYSEWIIRDEGTGFPWRDVLARLNTADLLGLSGRGIFLAKLQFDVLEYQDPGNCVRVRKNK